MRVQFLVGNPVWKSSGGKPKRKWKYNFRNSIMMMSDKGSDILNT